MRRNRQRWAIVVAGLVLGLAGGTLSAQAQPDRTSDLDRALDAVTEAGKPGALARVTADGASWRGASGVADIDTSKPMRADARFRIGSITKSFTATVVLQHVAEGNLRLDDPVARHLPGVLPDQLGDLVTVRMLLNHTSGLPDYDTVIYKENADVERNRFRFFTPDELIRLALTEQPSTPGGPFAYANTNYVLLGMLVERVSGHPIQYEVTNRIIRPLELHDTAFPYVSPLILGPHAKSYVPVGPAADPLVDFSVYTPTVFNAAGAMWSTAADVERFFDALLGGELLPPAQLAAMRTTVPTGIGTEYGLGLVKWSLCDTYWGHDGVVWGQTSISMTRADGRRQVTYTGNLSHYAASSDDPIDQAVGELIRKASCPAASGPSPARMPPPASAAVGTH